MTQKNLLATLGMLGITSLSAQTTPPQQPDDAKVRSQAEMTQAAQKFTNSTFNNVQTRFIIQQNIERAQTAPQLVQSIKELTASQKPELTQMAAQMLLTSDKDIALQTLKELTANKGLKYDLQELNPKTVKQFQTLSQMGYSVKIPQKKGVHPLTWLMISEEPTKETVALASAMIKAGAPTKGVGNKQSTGDILKGDTPWRSALQAHYSIPQQKGR